MKSIKLRTTLLGLFIILLVSNTLAAFAYINYNKLAIGEITKSLRLITHESSLFIGNLMAYQLKQLTRVAESDALKSGEIDRQLSYLSSLPLDYFETPFIADLEGNAMYLSGDTVYVGERDYFLNALKGITGYSDFFQSRLSGDMVVVATIPIKDKDGAIIGVMGAHINLDSISDIAGNKGYGKNGFSYIVNESGNIITNTNTPFSTNNLNIYSLADRNHNYIQMAQFISKSLETDEGMSSYTLNQTKNLSAFSSISGTNWRLYIGAPEQSLYESVNNFRL
ncbi:MAG TPA: cache domain-containing protein, partial [Fusibacter sp.]|nr:cache domain-containing protein [Fusibacter sp.]